MLWTSKTKTSSIKFKEIALQVNRKTKFSPARLKSEMNLVENYGPKAIVDQIVETSLWKS